MGSQPRGISASRGAAVLALSEWQTQFEAWQLICEELQPGFNASRGYTLPEFKESAALRWGTAFEDSVIQLSESASGQVIKNREQFWKRDLTLSEDGEEILTCHIDGWYEDRNLIEKSIGLHEGKTTSIMPYRAKWGEPGTAAVPKIYQVQTQHQMLCTGAELDIVSVLVFPETPDAWEKMGWKPMLTSGQMNSESWGLIFEVEGKIKKIVQCWDWAKTLEEMGFFHQYPVPADKTLQSLLLDGYRHFWDHHVLTGIEPDPSTYEDIRRAFPEPVGTLVVDDQMDSWLRELRETKEEISTSGRLGKRVEELKVLILDTARKSATVPDEASDKKLVFVNAEGKKLGQYNGRVFLT